MKKLLFIAVILSALTVVAGCSNPASSSNGSDPIIGTWKQSSPSSGSGGQSTIIFAAKSDNSFTLTSSNSASGTSIVLSGTWSVSNGSYTLNFTSSSITMNGSTSTSASQAKGTGSISGALLTITASNSSLILTKS